MRVSWNWLQDFVDLSGLTPKDVADTLTLAGLEVEGVEMRGHNLDGIVVARVLERSQHPDADRLSVCRVFDGEKEIQVVCGASNVATGVVVPLATIGTTMPGGLVIKKSKLRGETSEGMLCSATELGLPEGVDGLLLLDDALEIGTPIADALELKDVILDISLTPNRGDCLSVRGVAREIAVLLGRPLRETPAIPNDFPVQSAERASTETVTVSIDANERCKSYHAAVIRGVRVAPSPQWLRRRLEAVGQRTINNIVDVTNYINLEFGQPVHAFDLGKLEGAEIRVRLAKEGETLTTLDGKELALNPDDLVIADTQKPIALAGVMGGGNSNVDDATADIVFEVASFDGSGVRRSARRYHLHTESSHRFERGVDATAIPAIVERGIQLLAALQPQGVTPQREKGVSAVVTGTWPPREIPLTLRDLKRIIGVDYSAQEVRAALEGLGLGVQGDESMVVSVPPRRPDLERTVDLIEEVARVIGYDRLPNEMPMGAMGYQHTRRDDAPVAEASQPVVANETLDAYAALRQSQFTLGAFEAVNWAIVANSELELLRGTGAAERLLNPLSSDREVMRTTLLSGLLRNVKWNLARRAERVSLFEIGHVFPEVGGSREEGENLAAVLCGRRDFGFHSTGQNVDVWDITAQVVSAGLAIGRAVSLQPLDNAPAWVHPEAGAAIVVNGVVVGHVGQIHPALTRELDISVPVFAVEADLDLWLALPAYSARDVRLPRTIASDRDIAVILDAGLPYAKVLEAIGAFSHPLFAGARLFDVYTGANLPEGKRSLALRANYRHASESLTDAQIDEAHLAFTQHLKDAVGAERR